MTRTSRCSLFLAAVASAAALFAAPAQAGLLVSSAQNCADQAMAPVFQPWLDPANYVLAPNGDVESTAGWDLRDAHQIAGNEPWKVHDAADSSALHIHAGGSATTASMCVGIEHPDLRFFSQKTEGGPTASLNVEVLFEDAAGNVRSLPIGAVSGSTWTPTPIMVIGVNMLAVMPGSRTAVAFRFTANGGDYRIDDVYVDPWSRN